MQQRGLLEMHRELSRRDLLRLAGVGLSGLGLAAVAGCGPDDGDAGPTSTPGIVIDPPPETTTIRLPKNTLNPRLAPFFLADQFLPAEGFTNVQYVDLFDAAGLQPLVAGEIDIGMPFADGVTAAADAGDPLVILAGVNNSSFVLFGNDGVRSLRDLKGKRIWGKRDGAGPYLFWAALLAYVGIDVDRDVEFVDVNFYEIVQQALAGAFDAWIVTRPLATIFRNANIGHVIIDGPTDPPWSQYFGSMATANRDFVEKHPAATKRALRAILKATDVCATEPERAARYLVDKGHTALPYDITLDAMNGQSYTAWREFDPEDTVRFYALRLKEAGLVKGTPDELIARATDWRYLNEIKRELAV